MVQRLPIFAVFWDHFGRFYNIDRVGFSSPDRFIAFAVL